MGSPYPIEWPRVGYGWQVSPTIARGKRVAYAVTDDEILQEILLQTGKALKPATLRDWARFGYITPPQSGRGRGNRRNWPGESVWEAVAAVLLTSGNPRLRTQDLVIHRAIGDAILLGIDNVPNAVRRLYEKWFLVAGTAVWRDQVEYELEDRAQNPEAWPDDTEARELLDKRSALLEEAKVIPLTAVVEDPAGHEYRLHWWGPPAWVALREACRLGLFERSGVPPRGVLWLGTPVNLVPFAPGMPPLTYGKPVVARSIAGLGFGTAERTSFVDVVADWEPPVAAELGNQLGIGWILYGPEDMPVSNRTLLVQTVAMMRFG